MSLPTRIDDELLAALKGGDNFKRDLLRTLKSALKNSAIELGKGKLDDNEALAVITREAKKRRESIVAFEQADKPDLVAAEKAELTVLETYLPTLMSEADIQAKVTAYLAAHPTTLDQIGQAMGALSAELKGQADLGLVSKILRQQLGN